MRLLARTVTLLALFAVAGCRDNPIVPSEGLLDLHPRVAVLPSTYVGHFSEETFAITNSARFETEVVLSVDGPFELDTRTLTLSGGASRQLRVRFRPTAVGIATGTLYAADRRSLPVTVSRLQPTTPGTRTAALSAEALPPLDCPPLGPCRPRHFVPALGQCVEDVLPDGTACDEGNPCLLDASCQAGECVGSQPDCSDGNACTADACDSSEGCVHFDQSASCKTPENPCLVPVCDPAVGCTSVEALDGVLCGAADCESARICLSGSCQTVAVEDGASCGVTSPCQPRGQCNGQVCSRPGPQPLVPAWELKATPGNTMLFDSIGDALGNVYWRECTMAGVELVSATRIGILRYRVRTESLCQSEAMVLLGGTLLIRTDTGVEAYQAFGGAKLWSKDLLSALSPEFQPAFPDLATTQQVFVRHLSRGAGLTAVLGVEGTTYSQEGAFFQGTWLVSVSLTTGAIQWKIFLEALTVGEMLVDEADYLYLGTTVARSGPGRAPAGFREFVGYTAQGKLRWRHQSKFDHPAAVYGGRIYHWNQSLSDTATGEAVGRVTGGNTYGFPRMTLGTGFYVTGKEMSVNACTGGQTFQDTALVLTKYDPATAALGWTYDIRTPTFGGTDFTNLVLTSRGSIVFSQNRGRCPPEHREYVLREVTSTGEERYACPLPGPERYSGFGLLLDGLWVSQTYDEATSTYSVRAFAIPELAPPEHGWVAALGSASRDHRPR